MRTAPELVGVSTVPLPVDCLLNTAAPPRLTSKRLLWAHAMDVSRRNPATAMPHLRNINCPRALFRMLLEPVLASLRMRLLVFSVTLKQPDRLGLLHRRHSSQFSQNFWRHFSIHVHHRYRFPRSTGLGVADPAAQREVGNIDLVLAQNRAYFSDHAGNVAVTQVNEVALEGSFHVNPIHMQQSRPVLVQDGALYQVFSR